MAIMLTCPSCGFQGALADGIGVTRVSCPCCQTMVALPPSAPKPAPVVPVTPAVAAVPIAKALPNAPTPTRSPMPSLDSFFLEVNERASMAHPGGLSLSSLPVEPPPAVSFSTQSTQSPANQPVVGSADPEAELVWVSEERQRLEGFLASQFALLRKQREEFTNWHTRMEQGLVEREQGVRRQIAQVRAANVVLQTRDQELNARAVALEAGATERRAQLERELHTVQTQLEVRSAALAGSERDLERRLAECEALELEMKQQFEDYELKMIEAHRELEERQGELVTNYVLGSTGARDEKKLRPAVKRPPESSSPKPPPQTNGHRGRSVTP